MAIFVVGFIISSLNRICSKVGEFSLSKNHGGGLKLPSFFSRSVLPTTFMILTGNPIKIYNLYLIVQNPAKPPTYLIVYDTRI